MQRKEYRKEFKTGNGSKLQVGIVVSEFNGDVTEKMLEGALSLLSEWKVKNIKVVRVPGSFEIPYGCLTLLSKKRKPDAIIALGCIIKGETDHDKYIAEGVTQGIMSLMLEYKTPISFGVITTNNLAQAKARAVGKENKGIEAARSALQSVFL